MNTFIKKLSISILVLLLAASITVGCDFGIIPPTETTDGNTTEEQSNDSVEESSTPEEESSSETESETVPGDPLPEPPEGLTGFYYDQLSDNEKALYALLLASIEAGNLTVEIENTDYELIEECISRTSTAIYYDRPDLFILGNSRDIDGKIYSGVNDDVVTITWSTCNFSGDAEAMQSALDSKVEAILTTASALDSDYEKAKYVHDYLVQNTVYDEANMVEKNTELNSPYSCLVEGKAVCGGYARSFQLLMNRLGISCVTLPGTADGGPHAWNILTLDGENYLVDVTWDDTGREESSYAYFCITSAELGKTHVAEDEFSFPVCTATKYNYYKYEGLLLETYTFEAISSIITSQSGEDIAVIRFTSESELQKAIDELITEGRLVTVPGFEGITSISPSLDQKHLILYLPFPTKG